MQANTVIVADDHDLFRDGIKTLVKKMKDLSVIGEARDGQEVLELYGRLRPDLVLLDISMPDMNGMEASKLILEMDPKANIVILSMHDDEEYINRCLNAGVKGYVVKSESATELKNTIESVLMGRNYFSQRAQDVIIRKIKQNAQRKTNSGQSHITQREIEILKHIAQGFTSQEMADKLFISIRTVETHRANLMRKLGVKNAIELVKKAMELEIITS